MIAAQLPGRTDNEIKNLWNTKLRKVLVLKGINPITHQPLCNPLLSDYVKQCLKSIEHMLVARFVTLSPVAAGASTNSDALCSSSSLNDISLPPLLSMPTVPPATTEGSDEALLFNTNSEPNTALHSSLAGENSPSCDNFPVDFMLGEDAFLPVNLSYLNKFEESTSIHLSSGEVEALVTAPGYDYWS